MHKHLLTIVLAAGLAAPAFAQDGKPAEAAGQPTQPAATEPAPYVAPTPVWTDPEFEKIGKMLSGSWKTEQGVSAGEGATSGVVLSAAPVFIPDMPNAVYCEAAREDSLNRPYRQMVLGFDRVGGKVRITTYEFRRPDGINKPMFGTAWAPQAFQGVTKARDLVATLAMDLAPAGSGYSGKSPHAYPTEKGGAVEMTAEFTISPGTFTSADRGFGRDGKQVWGPEAGASTTFKPFQPGVKAADFGDGMWRIDYPSSASGDPAKVDDQVTLHYTGYLTDGKVFDSSHERNAPFVYRHGQRLIAGWLRMMEDTQAGQVRRMIIPGPFAYGAQGRRQSHIPPNATLVYDLQVLKVEPPPPPAEPVEQPEPVKAVPVEPTKPK